MCSQSLNFALFILAKKMNIYGLYIKANTQLRLCFALPCQFTEGISGYIYNITKYLNYVQYFIYSVLPSQQYTAINSTYYICTSNSHIFIVITTQELPCFQLFLLNNLPIDRYLFYPLTKLQASPTTYIYRRVFYLLQNQW